MNITNPMNQRQAFTIDTRASTLTWTASKVTGQHHGSLALKSGSLDIQGGKPVGGEFVVDMTSLQVTDIKDAKLNNMLHDHLRSDDFFSVAKFPTASFRLTKVMPGKGDLSHVSGDLTIKGITKPLSFDAQIDVVGSTAKAKGTLTIDRTEYGIKFRSGKFFTGLGDILIHDTFAVTIDLVAHAS